MDIDHIKSVKLLRIWASMAMSRFSCCPEGKGLSHTGQFGRNVIGRFSSNGTPKAPFRGGNGVQVLKRSVPDLLFGHEEPELNNNNNNNNNSLYCRVFVF